MQRAQRAARGRGGSRLDEVGYRFGLGEVETVVEKCAAREFPGLGDARPDFPAGFETAREQQPGHDAPAVTLQLEDRLACIRMRRGKEQRDAVVYRLPLAVEERDALRPSRHQAARHVLTEHATHDGADVLPRSAHDADTGAAGRGRDGNDGVAVGVHRAQCSAAQICASAALR